MYTFRNKRNISHKNDLDPSTYDLRFLFHSAQWIVAEFLRSDSGMTMEETGKLISAVQAQAGALVEDFGGKRLVLVEMSAQEEAIVLLQSHYPKPLFLVALTEAMDRRNPDTVRKTVRGMWVAKLVEGNPKNGYKLTGKGLGEAQRLFAKHA